MQSIDNTHSMGDESSTTNSNNKSHNNSYDNISHEKFSDIGSLSCGSSNGFGSTTPFFADVTLDISVAHDIAGTPEAATRKTYDANHYAPSLPGISAMPSLPEFQHEQIARQESLLSERLEEPYMQTQVPLPNSNKNRNDTSNHLNPVGSRQQLKQHQDQEISSRSRSRNDDYDSNDSGNDISDDDYDIDNHVMAHVTSNNTPGGRFRPFGNTNGNWRTRLQRKQWPKDISWAVAFWTVVPIGFFVPLLLYGGSSRSSTDSSSASSGTNASWLAAATSPRSATLHTLIWGLIVAAVLLPRLLYRTSGGVGAGDDARHFASQILLASAPISACVYLSLLVATYFLLPSAFWPYGLIPLWYLARDLYLFRRWKMTATTPGGRQAFFQALACAALDILSRSLKRKALYRTLVIVIVVQFGVIVIWRLSLLAALRSGSYIWTIVALVGGKWATGTVARLLTLMACGGVSNWFAEQSSLLESMIQMEGRQERGQPASANVDADNDGKAQSQGNSNGNNTIEDSMPEAYRMADASEYKSTVDPGMDGDYESDDEDFHDEDSDDEENYAVFLNDSAQHTTSQLSARRRRRDQLQRRELRDARSSTVRQLLKSGLTVSFGSVAKCGLLGGLAQFVWSQIRKIDHAKATFGGMRVMPVRGMERGNVDGSVEAIISRMMKVINFVARDFVRTHSDMAMSYVADYQMSYTRAAREVAMLLDEAGVEPIIHDDISTHISACVGGSVSGVIILFTGAVLVHQRNRNDPGVPDSAVALDMVIAFFFCYTLIFTAMEPLRASIKAVYVCFAQHPEALSQAFPLIFHRLSRMSQSNLQ